MFYNAAAKSGVEIHLGKPVKAVDESRPAVIFEDGSIVEADLVIGGDGARIRTFLQSPMLTPSRNTFKSPRGPFPRLQPTSTDRMHFPGYRTQIVHGTIRVHQAAVR
jgi:hypothetical protein